MLHFAQFFLRLYCRGDRFLQLYHELNLPFNCSIEAINKAVFSHFSHMCTVSDFLWSTYAIGQTIIFLPYDFNLSFFVFPRLILAVGDWMSTILPHMVWP